MQTKRQIQKEKTKELLIRTAYEVFSSRGIMAARMSDIAEAAGVSHGTVFLHFQTQDALIEEVVESYGQKIAMRTHGLADTSEHFEELLRAHLDAITEFEPFYTRLVIENRLLPPGARISWIALQSAISLHFSLVYDRGSEKAFNKRVPPHMLFNMWMGLVHYYLGNGDLFAPEGNVIRRYGDTLIQNYMLLLTGDNQKNES